MSEAPTPGLADPIRRFEDARGELRTRVERAEGLLLCTDFDGTLAPIESDPEAATITPENRTVLEELRDREDTRVAIVSGRALADVRKRVGLSGLAYSGNHGLELARRGREAVHPVAAKHRARIQRICRELAAELAEIEGTVVENKSVTATIHYRNTPEDAVPRVREAIERIRSAIGDGRIRKTGGKEIIELRPAVRWHKGMAVSLLAEDYDDWLPVYIGDDTTDESAFRAVGDGLAIYVGEGHTAAHYRIPHQREVAPSLRAIAAWRSD
ncbi:MAG: trehalose-phosphatase [Halalkalicoccus sp.]